ncbi:hypothetical protein GGX14DRAFT_487370, partial [Mycena pura]
MPSLPPINPAKTVAGIAVDPQTLERVIPESRRPDGTLRKQIKIRPGFTPQEDVNRFRGSRQTQHDANQLPKGHIMGWLPSSAEGAPAKPTSKSAKKNAKRREKKKKETVADNWEDDEDEDEENSKKTTPQTNSGDAQPPVNPDGDAGGPDEASLTAKLEKLDVK